MNGQTVTSRRENGCSAAALVLCSPNKLYQVRQLVSVHRWSGRGASKPREATLNRGFHVPNQCERFCKLDREQRNLVDTEQLIGVKREREKYLAADKMLLVEGCSVGVGWLEITVSTLDTAGILPRDDTLMPTTRTGCVLPELLESTLDALIERLRIDLDDI